MKRLLELERQLEVKKNDKECTRTATKNGLFHIFTHAGSFRGYGTSKVLLYDIHNHILSPEESAVFPERGNYYPPHVYLPLLGLFKARSQEEKRRIIDICWETKYGLQTGIWEHILIRALDYCGITQGSTYQR